MNEKKCKKLRWMVKIIFAEEKNINLYMQKINDYKKMYRTQEKITNTKPIDEDTLNRIALKGLKRKVYKYLKKELKNNTSKHLFENVDI